MSDIVSHPLADPPLETPKRAVGRPRRLTMEAIIEVACDLGLEHIDMAAVAERLNTGVGTLYSYVRSRDELLQLVVERLAGRYRVEDRGQDWRDLLREHAAMATAVFASKPHLIGNLVAGEGGPQRHDYSLRFVTMLVARGFERAVAVDLYIEVTQIVMGAAICALARRNLTGATKTDAVAIPDSLGDHRPTLERLIRDVDAGNPSRPR